jgi:tRNA-intron endonuclease
MEKIKGILIQGKVSSNSQEAVALFDKQRFGEKQGEKIVYMNEEAYFLIEEDKINIYNSSLKKIEKDKVLNSFTKTDKKFLIKYQVFCDLRKKGFTPKSALKFGSDYRIYEKGKNISKNHSEWICFVVSENEKLSMQEFTSKNRVAHSTKKKLLLAIVDCENDVSYYESSWKKIV